MWQNIRFMVQCAEWLSLAVQRTVRRVGESIVLGARCRVAASMSGGYSVQSGIMLFSAVYRVTESVVQGAGCRVAEVTVQGARCTVAESIVQGPQLLLCTLQPEPCNLSYGLFLSAFCNIYSFMLQLA